MPRPAPEVYPFKNLDKLYATAPHLSCDGLRRWFDMLPVHGGSLRRVQGTMGTVYDAVLRSRSAEHHDTVTVALASIDGPQCDIKLCARRLRQNGTDGEPSEFNSRLLIDPPHWVYQRGRVKERATWSIVIPGSAIGSLIEPPIVTIQSSDRLTGPVAEGVFFEIAPVDPDLPPPPGLSTST